MRFAAPRKSAMTFALICPFILSSCATTMGSAARTDGASALLFCDGAKPVRWSARDSEGTIAQVKEHNAVGRDACGWGS